MEGILEPPTDNPVARPMDQVTQDEPGTSSYPIRIVVMDVENVLFELRPWESWLSAQLEPYGIPAEQLIQRWYRSELLRCAHAGLISIWHAWHDFLLALGAAPGWAEELVIGIRCRYESALARCRIHPDATHALQELNRRNIGLAILADSHWRAPELQQVLSQMRLPVQPCAALTTAMIGSSGPDPQPYVEFLQRISATPSETAYVGWNRRPLEAARRAQLICVRFNGLASIPADLAITDLRDLPRHFSPPTNQEPRRAA